jgi:hypothetical protein
MLADSQRRHAKVCEFINYITATRILQTDASEAVSIRARTRYFGRVKRNTSDPLVNRKLRFFNGLGMQSLTGGDF